MVLCICKLGATETTNTSALIDSVAVYLDSVPELKNEIIKGVNEWKKNPKEIRFYPYEYEELRTHLTYSILPKYSFQERVKRATTLIDYKLSEEVKQYNKEKLTKGEVKTIFENLSDQKFYTDSTQVMDSYWADTDRLLVVVGQTHSKTYSELENMNVRDIQNEIYSLYENLYKKGINLFIEEGFFIREVDYRIPTKSSKSKICKDYSKKVSLDFDSLYDVLLYGFEKNELYYKGDSASKLPILIQAYIQDDSIFKSLNTEEFVVEFRAFIENKLDNYPESYKTNLDTSKMYNMIRSYLKDFDTVDSTIADAMFRNFSCDAYHVLINDRNKAVVETVKNIFLYSNSTVAGLKIGGGHLDRNNVGITSVGFENEMISIQDICKKEGISYVYLLTKTQLNLFYD